MDTVRGFATANRSTIVNVIYVVAFLVAAYYLYKFLTEGTDLDIPLSGDPISAASISANSVFTITGSEKYPKCRIKQGGEFTVSMWMYITSYDGAGMQGMPKPVFYIADSDQTSNYLMVGVLYPNENKMLIRAHTGGTDTTYTGTGAGGSYNSLVTGAATNAFTSGLPQCDIQDIDMQRWVNIVISVNGRIMDVYMDGKLTRSCILPNVIKAGVSGTQTIVMGGFPGEFSKVRYINYAATPDKIYSIYQEGPYKSKTILGYVGKSMGLKFLYTNEAGSGAGINL